MRSRRCPVSALRDVSRLYATEPVGVTDQPEFRNAVVAVDAPAGDDPAAGAMALLESLKAIERASGRRERERWGPRELDLDLLIFGRAEVEIERSPSARSNDVGTDPAKASRLLVVPHQEATVSPLRSRAAIGRRPLARPARLGRDRRHGPPPAGGHRRPGRRAPDRPLGRRHRPWNARDPSVEGTTVRPPDGALS